MHTTTRACRDGADGAQGIQGIQGVPGADGADGGTMTMDQIVDTLYPVGGLYISTLSTSPATLLGRGTWAAFGAGRVLVGRDSGDTDFDTAEETGGAKTHTLTAAEMPVHTHLERKNSATTGGLSGFGVDTSTSTEIDSGYSTGPAGSGGAHNNLPPYVVVYMWKRTA